MMTKVITATNIPVIRPGILKVFSKETDIVFDWLMLPIPKDEIMQNNENITASVRLLSPADI